MVPGQDRPDAPEELSERGRELWGRYVEAMPSGWFGAETFPVLKLLCQQVEVTEALTRRMENVRDNEMYCKLGRQLNQASTMVKQLSETLRLTPKSRYEHRKGPDRENRNAKRPWET